MSIFERGQPNFLHDDFHLLAGIDDPRRRLNEAKPAVASVSGAPTFRPIKGKVYKGSNRRAVVADLKTFNNLVFDGVNFVSVDGKKKAGFYFAATKFAARGAAEQAGLTIWNLGGDKYVGIRHPAHLRGEESVTEGVSDTILKQLGGYGRVKAMIGVKHFLTLKNGLAFKWPSRKRSKGNYVEITLTPDDLYDMEFFTVDKWGDKKPRKKYAGIMFDQLIPTFERQTGLALRL